MIAAVISSTIAIHILLRNRRSKIHLQYSYFNLNLVAWYIADALWASTGFSSGTLMAFRSLVATVIPLTALRFFRTFTGDENRFAIRAYKVFVALSILFAVLVVLRVRELQELVQGTLFAYIFFALYLTVFILYSRYRTIQSRLERTRLKYLIASGAVAFTLALADYTPGIGYYFFGNILTVIYLYFLFQVLVKLRILDLFEFIGKSLVTASFAFVLAAIYMLLVSWWRHELNLFVFNTVIASLVVVILFDPLRSLVEGWMNRLIFSEKFAFVAQMDALRRAMANIINLDVLANLLIKRLESSRRVTHASMYLLDDEGMGFRLLSWTGPRPVGRLDSVTHRPFVEQLTAGHALIAESLDAERSVLAEEGDMASQPAVEVIEAQLQSMDLLNSGVSVPLISDSRLIGLINVKDERLREAYSNEEIKILMSVAAQATITIENSRLYQRIRERDRLAALGEMAAGLAHEIRNPLGAIKGAAQLLGDHDGEVTEGDTEFVEIIVEEVNRLNTVVSQFLDYARPYKGNFGWILVNELVGKTAQLVSAEKGVRHSLELKLTTGLPEVQTDPELLKQVFINLAINAFQAMDGGGTLTISTDVVEAPEPQPYELPERTKPHVRVRFTDTGIGMSQEQLSRIFMPFYTTKVKGTGLGLAICDRIVKNLGGTIEVQSRKGRGTTFAVLLPTGD